MGCWNILHMHFVLWSFEHWVKRGWSYHPVWSMLLIQRAIIRFNILLDQKGKVPCQGWGQMMLTSDYEQVLLCVFHFPSASFISWNSESLLPKMTFLFYPPFSSISSLPSSTARGILFFNWNGLIPAHALIDNYQLYLSTFTRFCLKGMKHEVSCMEKQQKDNDQPPLWFRIPSWLSTWHPLAHRCN